MNGLARALLTIGLAASLCVLLAAPAGAAAPARTTILSFSGTSTGSGYTRTLQFDTPEDGRYVLRASTAGGTINVNFGGNGCCYRPIGPTLTDYDLGGLGPFAGRHVQIA